MTLSTKIFIAVTLLESVVLATTCAGVATIEFWVGWQTVTDGLRVPGVQVAAAKPVGITMRAKAKIEKKTGLGQSARLQHEVEEEAK